MRRTDDPAPKSVPVHVIPKPAPAPAGGSGGEGGPRDSGYAVAMPPRSTATLPGGNPAPTSIADVVAPPGGFSISSGVQGTEDLGALAPDVTTFLPSYPPRYPQSAAPSAPRVAPRPVPVPPSRHPVVKVVTTGGALWVAIKLLSLL